MRSVVIWNDAPELEEDGSRQTIWDMAFTPDGTKLLVAYGRFLLMYDSATGEVLRSKEAHTADIYSVTCSKDGTFIATGSSDKSVAVWLGDLNMKYTYTHADSVQAVAFNPVIQNVLASCSESDFAIWNMPTPQLRKHKVPSKILCCAWTLDGQYLALGMFNGTISIRDMAGAERCSFGRAAPVWDIAFAPPRAGAATGGVGAHAAPGAGGGGGGGGDDGPDTLAVACWDGTLSFYTIAGDKLGRDRQLGCDPCSVRYSSNGEYIIIGGSDRKATLYTRDGVKLATVLEGKDWVWRALMKPRSSTAAIGFNDGAVSLQSVVFATVHGLYRDRYAYRDAMTDVVVQHLVTEQRVRIKCRDYVRKIAVYKDRLAVQLPDKVIVYELPPPPPPATSTALTTTAGAAAGPSSDAYQLLLTDASEDTSVAAAAASGGASGTGGAGATGAAAIVDSPHAVSLAYRIRDRIMGSLDCNLLVVTSTHVVLCLDKKLQLYAFNGVREREWTMDAVIRYIKVVGGPEGREGLLVGLKSGVVLRIFVDNPFPHVLVKHTCAVRCLDLSMSRRKLAVVDENANCVVYDTVTKEQLFSEPGAGSVAWNSEMESMLSFSNAGVLSIKTGNFPLHTQKMSGFVVGFSGSKVFCLQSTAMETIDIPQSTSLHRYIDVGDWDSAYRVACLGVTEADWKHLGEAALRSLQLHVARAAFLHVGDLRFLQLLTWMEGALAAASRRARLQQQQQKQLTAGGSSGSGFPTSPSSLAALAGLPTVTAPGASPTLSATLLAEVAAYAGRYHEAARLHLRAGDVEAAVGVFADMRLWSEARKFAAECGGRVDVASLMLRQAAYCEERGEAQAAATIYASVGQAARAVHVLGERGLLAPALVDLVRSLPSVHGNDAITSGGHGASASSPLSSTALVPLGSTGGHGHISGGGLGLAVSRDIREALAAAGAYFKRGDLVRYARECYLKLGDTRALLQLHLDACQWDEALALANGLVADAVKRGDTAGAASARSLVASAHIAYGEWLTSEDRLEEAHAQYEAGGRPDLSACIMEELAAAAVEQHRFADAATHYLRLATDCAQAAVRADEEDVGAAAAVGATSDTAAAAHLGALESRPLGPAAARALTRFHAFVRLARLYSAYAAVHAFCVMPFSAEGAETLLHASRFIVNEVLGVPPHALGSLNRPPVMTSPLALAATSAAPSASGSFLRGSSSSSAAVASGGSASSPTVQHRALQHWQPPRAVPYRISVTSILYTVARNALPLACYKMGRWAVGALRSRLVQQAWRDTIDLTSMHLATKPFTDDELLTPCCYRCGATNDAVNATAATLLCPAGAPPRLTPMATLIAQNAAGAGGAAPIDGDASARPATAGSDAALSQASTGGRPTSAATTRPRSALALAAASSGVGGTGTPGTSGGLLDLVDSDNGPLAAAASAGQAWYPHATSVDASSRSGDAASRPASAAASVTGAFRATSASSPASVAAPAGVIAVDGDWLDEAEGVVASARGGAAATGVASGVGMQHRRALLALHGGAESATLATVTGDCCANCGHPVIRSCLSWQPLPLVEFTPADVSPAEAVKIVTLGSIGGGGVGDNSGSIAGGGSSSSSSGIDQQVLTFGPVSSGGMGGAGKSGDEQFNALLSAAAASGGAAGGGGGLGTPGGGSAGSLGGAAALEPVPVPRTVLAALRPSDVFIVRPGHKRVESSDLSRGIEEDASLSAAEVRLLPPRFFKNVFPEVAIHMSACCHAFFGAEDYELEVLKRGKCPLCRAPAAKTGL